MSPGTPAGTEHPPAAETGPSDARREQRGWYFYDWANSAFSTTIAAVLFQPYLIGIAENAAVDGRIDVLGLSVAPGALPAFTITSSTLLSAVLLPLLGAVADRTARKTDLLAGFAWTGAAAAAVLFFVRGDDWQLGVAAFMVANLCFGAAAVFNDALLCLISDETERDRVSSTGWAFGYAGGGLLLAANFVLITVHDSLGISEATAARICMLSAALWWGGFTVIPFRRIRNRPPRHVVQQGRGIIGDSFGQLWATLTDMRRYPMALTFLVAYLFFNDGIQTVIASSTVYGTKELDFPMSTMLSVFLLVQFVAVLGAVAFGRAAARYGAKHVILAGLAVWMGIVTSALVVPEREIVPFLAMALAIGIVLGGTQALARSYFSLMVPTGREAEYFSFYHAMERGTSWFGTLTFGVVYQMTDSYRPAIFALVAFFAVGGALLLRVDTARGIREAGNQAPAVI